MSYSYGGLYHTKRCKVTNKSRNEEYTFKKFVAFLLFIQKCEHSNTIESRFFFFYLPES